MWGPLALVLLILLVSACAPPDPYGGSQEERRPVCTPPACQEGEVYYCPDDCPGGCGTTCATPTAAAPTPRPVCTPPACQEDEVYYCPDDCPGGCGTICATPTALAAAVGGSKATATANTPPAAEAGEAISPTILSFTAQPAQIVQGESVQVSWEAQGGTLAYMTWPGADGLLDGRDNLNPEGGSVTIAPQSGPVLLYVSNDAGLATAELELEIACRYEWVAPLAEDQAGECPQAAEFGEARQQRFEGGLMIALEASDTVYALLAPPQASDAHQMYYVYEQLPQDEEAQDAPQLTPPAGRYQPEGELGRVWRADPELREALGWALEPASTFRTWRQSYQGHGMHNITTWLEGAEGTVYVLTPRLRLWRVYGE